MRFSVSLPGYTRRLVKNYSMYLIEFVIIVNNLLKRKDSFLNKSDDDFPLFFLSLADPRHPVGLSFSLFGNRPLDWDWVSSFVGAQKDLMKYEIIYRNPPRRYNRHDNTHIAKSGRSLSLGSISTVTPECRSIFHKM